MATERIDTLTIRLPHKLKSKVEATAQARATTVTGIVRQALQETLQPPGRLYQHPGYSPAFDDFVRDALATDRPVLVLVSDDRSGHRYFFEGHLDRALTNDSLVAVGARDARKAFEPPWIIPRRDVVAWFSGDRTSLNGLAMALSRQGWAARSRT